MTFQANRRDMLEQLAPIKTVLPRSTTVPALKNILLEASEKSVFVTATDLDVAYYSEFEAQIGQPGEICPPGAEFLDWIGLLPDGPVRFATGKGSRATITSGSSKLRLGCMLKDVFPIMAPAPEAQVQIEADILASILKRTQLAIVPEEGRYSVPGAYLIIRPGEIIGLSTDGHRLVYVKAPEETDMPANVSEIAFILPERAIGNVLKLCDTAGKEPIEFAENEGHLFFSCGPRTMATRKFDGKKFPAWDQILPAEHSETIRVPRLDLARVLSRVARFTTERSQAVKVRFTATGTIDLSWTGELADSQDNIEVERENKTPFSTALSGQYLLRFLQHEEVESIDIKLQVPGKPVEFVPVDLEGYDFRFLIMPIHI